MDPAEAHERLTQATGAAQPYAPPLETEPAQPELGPPPERLIVPASLSDADSAALAEQWAAAIADPSAAVRIPADARVLPVGAVSGMFATPLLPAANAVARSFGEAMASIGDFLECTSEVLDLLDQVEDDDGRAIWMTAGEVELDQWLARLVAARDAMRDRLAPREGS